MRCDFFRTHLHYSAYCTRSDLYFRYSCTVFVLLSSAGSDARILIFVHLAFILPMLGGIWVIARISDNVQAGEYAQGAGMLTSIGVMLALPAVMGLLELLVLALCEWRTEANEAMRPEGTLVVLAICLPRSARLPMSSRLTQIALGLLLLF